MASVAVENPLPSPGEAARQSTLTAMDLFAGAGGLVIGMHRAGFDVLDLVEQHEPCVETLRANADHFGWKDARDLAATDVHDFNGTDYAGRVSLLSAGAPCQPFSRGGLRRGWSDPRNMLPQTVRVIAQCRPRAFVIENVRGFLFESSKPYFDSLLAWLRNPTEKPPKGPFDRYHRAAPAATESDAYRVDYRILNAADFGLAQYRPRLFIVGTAMGEPDFRWPEGDFSRESLIEDLRGEAYWAAHPGVSDAAVFRARARLPKAPLKRGGKRWRTLRDLTAALGPPADPRARASDPSHVLVRGARLYEKHTGSQIDWVAKTVKAGVHGTPGGEHILVTTPKRFRYLTVRECAELQGFPHDYQLPVLRTPAMRQLGNAVPVPVAEALGLRLRECLSQT